MDGLRVLVAWLLALLTSLWLIPRLIRLGPRVGMMDYPGERKPHAQPTPLLGGVGIFVAAAVGGLLMNPPQAVTMTALPGGVEPSVGPPGWVLGLGSALCFAIGFLDDYLKSRQRELRVAPKFLLQLLPAAVLVLAGVRFHYVSNPFGGGVLYLPVWLDVVLTVLWVVGMANAINFIDGLDGLAAGVVSVATFTLTIVALALGQVGPAVWMAALLGACLGFLRYNFSPARIFMGDSGALFLGFTLAVVALAGYFKTATVAGLVVPLFALSLPVLNGVFVVGRRLLLGRPAYQADREHSFDVLRRRGYNTTETVLIFLLIAMALSAAGMGIALRQ